MSSEQIDVRHAPGVVVVLGAAVWPHGQASPALQRRMLHAITLVQRGVATHLLLTGGVGKHPPAEAHVMQRLAHEHGIPSTNLIIEDRATSTLESARLCSDLLRQHGWNRAIVTTDAYHLARALFAFRCFGVQVVGSAAPGQPARRLWKRWYHYGRERCAFGWYALRLLPVVWRRWRRSEPVDLTRL